MYRPGLYTACVTPFTEDGKLDLDSFKALVQRQVSAGAQGIVIAGTTGESPTISEQEKKQLIECARNITDEKTLVMAGCGTNSTIASVEQARSAEQAGAQALQVPTPSYNKPSQEGLFLHFKTIHDAVSTPIFIYNVPGRTSVNIEPKTAKRLLELERCAGIKEASGNIVQCMDVVSVLKQQNSPRTLLSGDDLLALPFIAIGAHGVMSVLSNLLPQTTQKLIQAALKGNMEEAKQLHYLLKPFIQACFIESNPTPIKYMLSLFGLCDAACRLPLAPLSSSSKQTIDTLFQQHSFEELS